MSTTHHTKWQKTWDVTGSKGDIYTVAIDTKGQFGCSCPVWKYQRKECKHILQVKRMLAQEKREQSLKAVPEIDPIKSQEKTPAQVIDWGMDKNVWF